MKDGITREDAKNILLLWLNINSERLFLPVDELLPVIVNNFPEVLEAIKYDLCEVEGLEPDVFIDILQEIANEN